MSEMQKLPDDDPIIVAWKAYCQTDEAKNSRRWAQRLNFEQDTSGDTAQLTHPHLDGSLWAVFLAGYRAGKSSQQQRTVSCEPSAIQEGGKALPRHDID